MTHHTKVPPTKGPPPRVKRKPRAPAAPESRQWWLAALAAAAALAIAGPLAYYAFGGDGGDSSAASAGLPDTPDYHSLLVAPADPGALVLGTHGGLYRSADGGRTWRKAELGGNDAMNLAQPGAGRTVWAAGHNVLARSTDGGATWTDVRPDGLPSLDVHGFAVDPRSPERLFAAIAGEGLYRSEDDGGSFEPVSQDVGAGVMALAVLPDGMVLAGDMQRRALMVSSDGGAQWRPLVQAPVMGLAVDPSDPKRLLASGPGVLRSTNGGKTWTQPLEVRDGTGPIAFSPSEPTRAYVVGFDRTLYRSDDGGATWAPVAADGKEG